MPAISISEAEPRAAVQPQNATQRPVLVAILASLPNLVLTFAAALHSNALTIKADLALSLLDMSVLVAAWIAAGRGRKNPSGPRPQSEAEAVSNVLVALCMVVSMVVVAGVAASRLVRGNVDVAGSGIFLALALNAVYALINGWILCGWRRRLGVSPSPFIRAQACLFADKLSSNLLIASSLAATLAFAGSPFSRFIDPLAGLLIATASARWATPVICDAVRQARVRVACGSGS